MRGWCVTQYRACVGRVSCDTVAVSQVDDIIDSADELHNVRDAAVTCRKSLQAIESDYTIEVSSASHYTLSSQSFSTVYILVYALHV